MTGSGPLQGLKIVEFAGIGPGPFCGMLLSDMGAEVVRIDRAAPRAPQHEHLEVDRRGRSSVVLDLKQPEAVAAALALCERADALIEGFRPGVMERLGLGPAEVQARNPRLVYGRMTGWGQTGPYAQRAGHDINYIAISGALHAIGTEDKPVVPLNLVGDYGGGAMMLAVGLLAAILHARSSGQGQVVDAAISDGTAYLTAVLYKLKAIHRWQDRRVANLLDGGAPFYDTYRCADGRFVAVGAIEPQFYALLMEKTGLSGTALAREQMNPRVWPELRAALTEVFLTRTRDEWVAEVGEADVCFAPVLTADEAASDPHNAARGTFVDVQGVRQPAPAPRFSATPSRIQPSAGAAQTREMLARWGLGGSSIDALTQA